MSDINSEMQRLAKASRGYACSVRVSEPVRIRGIGGATLMGCSFCGRVISGMCGPGGPGTACQMCATAIRDDRHPLGSLLRDAWQEALRKAARGKVSCEGCSHGDYCPDPECPG